MSWDHGYCMCGAIDCPWCGPAQGYNPEESEEEDNGEMESIS